MIPGEMVSRRDELWGRKLLVRRELRALAFNRRTEGGVLRIRLHVDQMKRRLFAAEGAAAIGCQRANAGLDRDLIIVRISKVFLGT